LATLGARSNLKFNMVNFRIQDGNAESDRSLQNCVFYFVCP
jgi:hypothetical protein